MHETKKIIMNEEKMDILMSCAIKKEPRLFLKL